VPDSRNSVVSKAWEMDLIRAASKETRTTNRGYLLYTGFINALLNEK
jgi:hypothetical protein